MAEVIYKERTKLAEVQHLAAINEQKAVIHAMNIQHLAAINEHEAAIHAMNIQHSAEINEHEATIHAMNIQHSAAINEHEAATNTVQKELEHVSEMLNMQITHAENQLANLKDEMALARHRHIQSTFLAVTVVEGEFHYPR